MIEPVDVIIVGAGPVGLGLAIDLGQRGVACLLVERNPADHRIPKGQSLTNRTLEHFRAWNCVDQIREARTLPRDMEIGGITAYRSLLGEYWTYASGGGPGRGDSVRGLFAEAPERLPQYATEHVLRQRLSELPSVRFLRGWTLESLESDDAGVGATVAGNGERETCSARYIVGCDGSRSTVRELAGISASSQDLGARMVLAVFRSPEFENIVARFPPSTTLRVLSPELKGHWQFFGRIDARDTWFFHAPISEDSLPEEAVMERLFAATGQSFAAEVQHAGVWDLRISVADEYRKGNVFIAGDACHSHPPYGGFGLNSGLEDVRNLGWKLAARLQGWGGDALLESYTQERRPVFERTAEIINGFIDGDRLFMERHDPTLDKAAFEEAWAKERDSLAAARFLPHYEGSPVVFGSRPGIRPGVDGEASRRPRPGHHLAPLELSDGRQAIDLLGSNMLLLAFSATDEARRLVAAAAELGLTLDLVEDQDAQGPDTWQRLVLVRPDGFIAWSGDELPLDSAEMLRCVSGM